MTAVFWKRVHLGLFFAWLLLLPPSILWWRESLPYLVGMSWYAIAIGHISSWQSARVERKEEKDEDQQ